MPYNPALDTIGERIVQSVQAALETIAPPTYATAVKKVRRWNGNAFNAVDYPAIAIVEGPEDRDDSRLGRVEHLLPIHLVLAVHGKDWQDQLKRLAADVRVALTNDWTRGGIALDTKVDALEVFDSEPSSPLGVAQIDARVRFRTLYHDPCSAI